LYRWKNNSGPEEAVIERKPKNITPADLGDDHQNDWLISGNCSKLHRYVAIFASNKESFGDINGSLVIL
jgi:hypothetical protein